MKLVHGAVDKDKCLSSVWFEGEGGQEFLVARADNSNYTSLMERLKRPHQRKLEQKKLDGQVIMDILYKAMSQAILLDWRGVNDIDGNQVPYTPEAGYDALSENIDFKEQISAYSYEEGAYFKTKVKN